MASLSKKEPAVGAVRRKSRQLVYLRRRKLVRLAEGSEDKGQPRQAPRFQVLMRP